MDLAKTRAPTNGNAARATYRSVARGLDEAFRDLPLEARQIVRLCDGTRRLRAICELSPIAATRTEQVIDKLVSLGLVERCLIPPSRTRFPDTRVIAGWLGLGGAISNFSVEDESFFSSRIDHLVEGEHEG